MNAVIIGGGSIGKRHASNLRDLNIETKIVDIDEIDNIDTILSNGFDMGFVCTPNVHHIKHCITLAKHNIPIFCEKPFYSDTKQLDELLGLVTKYKLNTMVGCNLRFTEEVEAIDSNAKYISVYFGYDLRKWRVNTNHLESYSANKKLGGGILLDAIHELDYLYYKFGAIQDIHFDKYKLSDVTIDTEDIVHGHINFVNGTIAYFTLNYLSEEYTRYYEVMAGGSLLRRNLTITNDMYVKEMKYFVDCILNKTPCMNSFEEAHTLLSYLI